MALKAQHTFQKMDSDTADRYLSEGKYRSALNIHIGSSENNEMLSVENVKGNTLVSYSLPSGTNKVIGSHEDIVNKCVYYFLCNESSLLIQSTSGINVTTTTDHGLILTDLVTISGISGRTNILGDWIISPLTNTTFKVLNPLTYLGATTQEISLTGTSGISGTVKKYAHSILKYDSINNSISLVYKHSRLNFNAQYPVSGAALLSNVLHWTDGFNPPRSIMLDYTSTYGTWFFEALVDFIRIPPSTTATVTGKWLNSVGVEFPYNDLTKDFVNYMDDKTYQFIYRYVYMDDSRSVWSPISSTIATGYPRDKKNTINIIINNEELSNKSFFSKVIKSIEIAFKDGVNEPFKYIDRIDFPSVGAVPIIVFKNISAYSILDQADTGHYFESIPTIGGSLTAIQNRVFIGDCTEGFDVDPSDFSISTITYNGSVGNNSIKWKEDGSYNVGIEFYDRAERRSGAYKLGTVTMPNITVNPNAEAPRFVLTGTPPDWATHYRILRSGNIEKSYFIQGYAMTSVIKDDKSELLFNTINGPISYVPTEGDILILGSPATNTSKFNVLSIGSDAFGNSTIVVKGIVPVSNTDLFKVEIYSRGQNANKLFYETPRKYPIYNPGTSQRSFFAPLASNVIGLDEFDSGDIYRRNLNDSLAYHARAVISVDRTELISELVPLRISINGDIYSLGPSKVGDTFILEKDIATLLLQKINRSNKTYKAFLFYDGQDLNSSTPNRNTLTKLMVYETRLGSLGNIDIVELSTGGTPGFDQYGIYASTSERVTGIDAQFLLDMPGDIEAMSSNDRFQTWDNNTGRATVILSDGNKETRRESLVRFGGRNVLGTALNNAHSFYFDDQKELSNSGKVRKLIAAANNQAEGSVLLAAQDNDISSIYIGQTVLKNAGGGQSIATTDSVIGTVNSLQKLVGTVNPESVVQNNGTVYGFDALRGIVWRYGQDGLTFISEETGGGQPGGMKNFFYKASKYLLSLSSFKCYAGIDPYSNEYILTIPSSNATESTVVFSETINGWTSFMSFIGEWYQKINTRFISFKSGQLWLHQNNPLYNNFYGVQYESNLRFICNKEPFDSKILQVVEEIAKGAQWDCSDISTPEGQSSELLGLYDISSPNTLPADFTKYENRYSANVMRDKNTPNLQSSDYPLLNGDEIRSDVFSILLRNNKTTQQNLYGVNLYYVPSYKSM